MSLFNSFLRDIYHDTRKYFHTANQIRDAVLLGAAALLGVQVAQKGLTYFVEAVKRVVEGGGNKASALSEEEQIQQVIALFRSGRF